MVILDPEDLRLVAIYGLVLSISVIIFGAYIGKWIDQSHRLKAAQVFLAIQNLSTAISCILLALYFAKVGESSWPTWIPTLVPILTIILADIGQIASVGSKIILLWFCLQLIFPIFYEWFQRLFENQFSIPWRCQFLPLGVSCLRVNISS